ncbi:MAG: pantoate--beta-alanine ligase [Thermaerobacter sp.]|nr:pantoate--beta-alanine ligase [Thermaerobacter sp.]
MDWITGPAELRRRLASERSAGRAIGLVPTMGYLHRGHAALMRALRPKVGCLVLSIFVNPTQFALGEDLATYPRNLEADRQLAESEGVDVVFSPTAEGMYPVPSSTFVMVEGLSSVLEGASRPTHFRGVTTVVTKLLHVVQPDLVVFGQKDAQQVVLVRRMLQELLFDTRMVVIPTVRDHDGLALSSRNAYLSSEERTAALVLVQSLAEATKVVQAGERDARAVAELMGIIIAGEPLAMLDYAVAVHASTLAPVQTIDGKVLLAVAARFGRARLLDNACLMVDGPSVSTVLP